MCDETDDSGMDDFLGERRVGDGGLGAAGAFSSFIGYRLCAGRYSVQYNGGATEASFT